MCSGFARITHCSGISSAGAVTAHRSPPSWSTLPIHPTVGGRKRSRAYAERFRCHRAETHGGTSIRFQPPHGLTFNVRRSTGTGGRLLQVQVCRDLEGVFWWTEERSRWEDREL